MFLLLSVLMYRFQTLMLLCIFISHHYPNLIAPSCKPSLYYTIYCILVQLFFCQNEYNNDYMEVLSSMKSENSVDRIIQVNDINIGKNIALLRKSMSIKQKDMVAKLQVLEIDISIYSYNRIEKGTQNPTVSFLYACCKILNCDFNTLFQNDLQ